MDVIFKWDRGRTVVVQRGISEAWRSGWRKAVRAEDTGHVRKLCIKHCLTLKTFIPNFVASLMLLEIVLSCIHMMSSSVTSAKPELTPAVVSLFNSRGVDTVH